MVRLFIYTYAICVKAADLEIRLLEMTSSQCKLLRAMSFDVLPNKNEENQIILKKFKNRVIRGLFLYTYIRRVWEAADPEMASSQRKLILMQGI